MFNIKILIAFPKYLSRRVFDKENIFVLLNWNVIQNLKKNIFFFFISDEDKACKIPWVQFICY